MNLRFLRPLYDWPGPWATVYLDDSVDIETGRAEVALRWRGLRESLRRQGAREPTLTAVAEAILDAPPQPGAHGLAIFAHDADLVRTEMLMAPPSVDSAEYGPLPHVGPLLAQRGQEISGLRAVAAQQQADDALDRFRQRHGEDAVIGIAPVITALNRGQADTLLLDPVGLAGNVLWLDPASGRLAQQKADLPDGGASADQVLAEDALIRAATCTDADLLMIGGEGDLDLREGVGAVLRPSDVRAQPI
jgi:hypothetical protein